jgi:hypothetical protein
VPSDRLGKNQESGKIASSGIPSMLHGPVKPVGTTDPRLPSFHYILCIPTEHKHKRDKKAAKVPILKYPEFIATVTVKYIIT